MKIRSKATMIIGITALVLLLALYTTAGTILNNFIENQEVQSTQKTVERVIKMLSYEGASIEATVGDWAQYDDTYEFIKDKNSTYSKANFTGSTFLTLNLNILLFINNQGQIVYGKGFDTGKGKIIELPDDIKEYIKSDSELFKHNDVQSVITGILPLKEGPLMISSRPITSTDMTAPINGTLIFGRYLSQDKIHTFDELTDASVSLKRTNDAKLDPEYKYILHSGNDMTVLVKPINADSVGGYKLIQDVFKKSTLLLGVRIPRNSYKQGVYSEKVFIYGLMACIIIVFACCIWLLQKTVISRLERLNQFLQEISATRDLSRSIDIKGKDEISNLSEAANRLLSKINMTQNELREREEQLNLVIEGSNDGFWDWNIDSGRLYFSNRFIEMIGYMPGELEKHQSILKKLMDEEDYKVVTSVLRDCLNGVIDFYNTEFRLKTKSGELKWFSSKGKVVKYDKTGRPLRMAGIASDVTESKKNEEEIRFLSYNDMLTGLYNRAFYEKELKKLDTSEKLPFTIIMGDLNGLKLTNDIFGHEEGDRLLYTTASILKNSCCEGDITARWGGDEFAIILKDSNEEDAAKVCERIIDNCIKSENLLIKPSIALGTATKADLSRSLKEILKEAEEKMYRNKLLESRSARSSIITSLRQTLAEKSYETEEHAQRLRTSCVELGKAIGMKNDEIDQLALLATLHDIGKIAIPDEILAKQGKLNTDECEIIKRHSEVGYRIAKSSPETSHIAVAILAHHERFDGNGYPQGLKGSEIPLISRVLSIVDAFDAMTSKRVCQETISEEEAIEELKRCAGSQFDPVLVKEFINERK